MSLSRIVLPALGGETMSPRCPRPMGQGQKRSIRRHDTGQPGYSRVRRGCGSMEVRSSNSLVATKRSGSIPSMATMDSTTGRPRLPRRRRSPRRRRRHHRSVRRHPRPGPSPDRSEVRLAAVDSPAPRPVPPVHRAPPATHRLLLELVAPAAATPSAATARGEAEPDLDGHLHPVAELEALAEGGGDERIIVAFDDGVAGELSDTTFGAGGALRPLQDAGQCCHARTCHPPLFREMGKDGNSS